MSKKKEVGMTQKYYRGQSGTIMRVLELALGLVVGVGLFLAVTHISGLDGAQMLSEIVDLIAGAIKQIP